LTTPIDLVYLL